MKNQLEIKKGQLKVATLNYTGVITSPYQYYQEEPITTTDKSKKNLNQILSEAFNERLQKSNFYTGKQFSWNMGTLDTVWKTRYTPFNRPQVGVKQTNMKFVENKTDQEIEKYFIKNWEIQKNKDQKENLDLMKYKKEKYSQKQIREQIQMCLKFDLLCYQTLAGEYGPNYKQRQEKQFKKAYLNEDQKIKKTINFIQAASSDIFYFQQTSQKMIEGLKAYFQKKAKTNVKQPYHIIKNTTGKSIILAKTDYFSQLNDIKLEENKNKFFKAYLQSQKLPYLQAEIKKIESQFNANNDSIFAVIDHYVFWNVHLTSKEHNKNQLLLIADLIKSIRKIKGYDVVLGGDFNATITLDFENKIKGQISNCINEKKSTVKKKRTRMQPQVKKADKGDFSSKDYIFSNLQCRDSQIKMLNAQGKDIPVDDIALLPNSNHPYDHYIVRTTYKTVPSITVRKVG